jgi:hypothetical protein
MCWEVRKHKQSLKAPSREFWRKTAKSTHDCNLPASILAVESQRIELLKFLWTTNHKQRVELTFRATCLLQPHYPLPGALPPTLRVEGDATGACTLLCFSKQNKQPIKRGGDSQGRMRVLLRWGFLMNAARSTQHTTQHKEREMHCARRMGFPW